MTNPFKVDEVFMVGYLRTPESQVKKESSARQLAWLYGQDKFLALSEEEQGDLRKRVEVFTHGQT